MRASHQPQPSCERNQGFPRNARTRNRNESLAIRCRQFRIPHGNQTYYVPLPKRTMGGYGLPFPKLNFPIEPTSAVRKAAHKQRYVLDLYWPKRKIDVEYDSDSYHASSEGIASDAQRRNALQLMGVTVITVTRGQLYNAASFDRTARIIATSIRVRLPKTSQRWISQNQMLRYVLLKNETKPSEKGIRHSTTG